MQKAAVFTTDGTWLRDAQGRVCILRGCNVSGASKVPILPAGETHLAQSLLHPANVSFIGRPFLEDEADEHFKRLKSWGFTFLRWIIPWEAIEHAGPGQYDEDFLAYTRRLLKKCEEYGISVFIDPHQDVWSRFTGGDGAPAWTLEACGFDVAKISASASAYTHQAEGKKYRHMNWFLNRNYYACATMFTLFFGGNTFAPDMMADGESIQNYLQSRFISAMVHTARRLKDCACIVGFGSFNEPSRGFIENSNLTKLGDFTSLRGIMPSPFEAMKAASGFAAHFAECKLTLGGVKIIGHKTVNENGISLFKDGFECPWKRAGVWGVQDGLPELLKKDYFAQANNKKADFAQDFLKPFLKRYVEAFQKKHQHYLFFIEGEPNEKRPSWNGLEDSELPKLVDAFHWYDGKTLILKRWHSFLTVDNISRKIIFGKSNVRRSFINQINRYVQEIRGDGMPPFVGEFGVPFDLADRKSFKTGIYAQQDEALTHYYHALDELLLSAAIWNYTPSNTHEHGDGWNGEDLSVFCRGRDGANTRNEKSFCRPYAMAVAGIPLKMHFNADLKKPVFEFEWDAQDGITEIFVPSLWFASGWKTRFDGTGGTIEINGQCLSISGARGKCRVTVSAR